MNRDAAIFGAFAAVSALVVLIVFGTMALPSHEPHFGAGRPMSCKPETTDTGTNVTCSTLDGGQ